jgi:hypothetical protein
MKRIFKFALSLALRNQVKNSDVVCTSSCRHKCLFYVHLFIRLSEHLARFSPGLYLVG